MKQTIPFSFAPIVATLLLLATAGCAHRESSNAAPPPPAHANIGNRAAAVRLRS